MQAVLMDFGTNLAPGITQSALRTPEHRQKSPRSCFYACLVASRLAITHGVGPSENIIITLAEQSGLLGPHGAETSAPAHDRQTTFIGKALDLQVRFIDQRYDDERVEALTDGLKDRNQAVIFGVKRHWLVLDGFKLTRNSPSWIGMDPASGHRLESSGHELSPGFLAARLVDSGLPLVVVEGLQRSIPRFRGVQR